MKSLEKIFDILEYLVMHGEHAILPTEIAEQLQISAPTCVRILQSLVSRGYVVQLSRQAGYLPGPMICTLACRKNVYTDLVNASRTHLDSLSDILRMPVNLAVLHKRQRIMLYFSGKPSIQWHPWPCFLFKDHSQTATGRLLLSVLPKKEQQQLLSSEEYLHELPSWNRNNSLHYINNEGMHIQGFLLQIPNYPNSAFGYGIRADQDADEIFSTAQKIAQKISKQLIAEYPAY